VPVLSAKVQRLWSPEGKMIIKKIVHIYCAVHVCLHVIVCWLAGPGALGGFSVGCKLSLVYWSAWDYWKLDVWPLLQLFLSVAVRNRLYWVWGETLHFAKTLLMCLDLNRF